MSPDRLQPLLSPPVESLLAMSEREVAAARPYLHIAPSSDTMADLTLVTFERNAYRDRCHALERMVAFLLGREPQPGALDCGAHLEAQRNAVLDLLARHPLPAASN